MPYADPLKRKAYLKGYCKANAVKARARTKEWREADPTRAQDAVLKSRKAKPEKYRAMLNAQAAKRRAQRRRAIPPWVNLAAIREIYARAAESNAHVDHVVPLVSDLVCGLHCESNLQILPGPDNIKKSNRRWPDMPDQH